MPRPRTSNRGLVGIARTAVASGAQTGTFAAQSTLTALNQITFPIAIVNDQCVYPSPSPNTVTAKIGPKLRWLNSPSNTTYLVVHSLRLAERGSTRARRGGRTSDLDFEAPT